MNGSDQVKKAAAGLGMITLLAMWITTPIGAQELARGTWTGTMSPPGSPSVDVTYEVGEGGGGLSIVMNAPQGLTPFNDVQLDGDELTFWWEPNIRVDCTLLRKEDGSFEGPCSPAGGEEGTLTMVPPSGGRS